jgi:hypothetical protein
MRSTIPRLNKRQQKLTFKQTFKFMKKKGKMYTRNVKAKKDQNSVMLSIR